MDAATQPTVLLEHAQADGTHYDWLIARPGEERLWTARVASPGSQWAALGRFTLDVLPPHRRDYLTYEGPVSGGRGTVRRVDAGTVRIVSWDEAGAVLDVAMQQFRGRVRLTVQTADRWIAELA